MLPWFSCRVRRLTTHPVMPIADLPEETWNHGSKILFSPAVFYDVYVPTHFWNYCKFLTTQIHLIVDLMNDHTSNYVPGIFCNSEGRYVIVKSVHVASHRSVLAWESLDFLHTEEMTAQMEKIWLLRCHISVWVVVGRFRSIQSTRGGNYSGVVQRHFSYFRMFLRVGSIVATTALL